MYEEFRENEKIRNFLKNLDFYLKIQKIAYQFMKISLSESVSKSHARL